MKEFGFYRHGDSSSKASQVGLLLKNGVEAKMRMENQRRDSVVRSSFW